MNFLRRKTEYLRRRTQILLAGNYRTGKSGYVCGILFLFTSFSNCAFAQLTETDTLKFGYKFTLNGSWLTGNVERLLLISTADISTVQEKWAIRTSNTYQFGTFGKFKTENDLFSKNFFYLVPHSKVYPYLMAWLETNKRRNFQFRYQIGPGASWAFLKKQEHSMKLSFTVTYEQTFFNDSTYVDSDYNNRDKINLFRGTTRLYGLHHFFKDRLRLRYEIWGQLAFEDAGNYRLHGDVFAEMPLTKLISFRAGFNYNYESVTLTTVKQQDTFLVFGISVANYK